MLAAVGLVMIDHPKHVEGFDEFAFVVVKLDRALQPRKQLGAIWIISDQRVDESWCFVDEAARSRNPIVFEIARASFQTHHDHRAAVLVRPDHSLRLNPQDIALDVVASVEMKMADSGVRAKGHPWALLFRWADVDSRLAVLLNYVRVRFRNLDDLVCG